MKKTLTVFALSLITIACLGQKESLLDSKAFKKVIEETEHIQLIDVRTQKEFDEGHIKDSKLIDFYKEDFRDQMNKLDKSKPIAVYCTVGGRSGATARMLTQLGFTKVYDLRGGIIDWQKVGLKLVKD